MWVGEKKIWGGWVVRQTGFHPVWYKKVEKKSVSGINLRVCRIVTIPTWEKDRVGVIFRILSERSLQLK